MVFVDHLGAPKIVTLEHGPSLVAVGQDVPVLKNVHGVNEWTVVIRTLSYIVQTWPLKFERCFGIMANDCLLLRAMK